jgi:hypothetical protein
MLRILGSPKTLCDGLTRRETLIAGGLGLFGLSLQGFFRLQEATAGLKPAARQAKAKAVILLHLYGSHSQLETVDMKPDAPPEVRGELKPIRSSLPGLDVCELLPNMAKVMDRVTVVRSVTHPYPIHGVAYALTGVPQIEVQMELSPHDGKHWPYIGSVVDHVFQQREGTRPRPVPDNIALPFPFSSRRVGEVPRAGPYAAFLGSVHNPTWTEFLGESTRSVVKTLTDKTEDVKDPYLGITPQSRFQLATSTELPADMTIDRLSTRRSLTEQFEQARRQLDADTAGKTLDRHRTMAYNLINSDKVRKALDIQSESPRLRDSYGMTLFGQSCLAARRLVEAGSRFVTVFWDEYGLAGSGWDTHWDHYPRMKDELLPGLDMGYAGLIADLDARGMLDETLVLLVSEHGRTPKLNNAKGGGRDHWSQAYSCWFAGGGVARGRVIGKTDKIAGSVLERPVSPKDILATTYHLLGIDPHTLLTDRTGRPVPLVQDASVVGEMLG